MPFQFGEEVVSDDEMVQLCAMDTELFNTTFFPNTYRQPSAPFHKDLDHLFDDPAVRFGLFRTYRGSSKTTRFRSHAAKRIAYGVSRTILYVGASEDHAVRSVSWIRRQIERNPTFANTFHLVKGSKWHETQLEIINTVTGHTAWVMGVGYTGNLRGINFDDYRPDLIFLDDIITGENAATEEQRMKLHDTVTGALMQSLAPETEEPNAKMMMGQTPLNRDDSGERLAKLSSWETRTYACWTDDTIDLSIDEQESSWPERFTSQSLRQQKRDYIEDNNLSTFVREMECRLISTEATIFKPTWLRYDDHPPMEVMKVLAIDPVPPPSDIQLAKGLAGKDYEAIVVAGRTHEDYFLYDYRQSRGHEPNWTIATVFEMAFMYKVFEIVVEGVNYQRALKWLLETEMQRRGVYWPVFVLDSKQKKHKRITNSYSGPASQGHFHVRSHHVEFITQFQEYGPGFTDHVDILDAGAMAMERLQHPMYEAVIEEHTNYNDRPERIIHRRGSP